MTFLHRFMAISVLLLALGLGACSPQGMPPESRAEVGTRALINRAGQFFEAEITDVRRRLVTMEFRWQGGTHICRDYYRGLYPTGGEERGERFELDFDENALEALFPLKTGKSVTFPGNLKLVKEGLGLNVEVTLQVKGEKTLRLDSGVEDVFIVDFTTRFTDSERAGQVKKSTAYYSPRLGMILKYVVYKGNRQSYWRVTRVEKASPGTSQRRRRAGTVAV